VADELFHEDRTVVRWTEMCKTILASHNFDENPKNWKLYLDRYSKKRTI